MINLIFAAVIFLSQQLNIFSLTSSDSEVVVEKINLMKLDSLIENRNGKILFINVWATWCVPCREEFPDLVKLHASLKNSDVEITAISVDFPDEIEDKIIPFLKKQGVKFKSYVGGFKNDEELINRLNKGWRGDVPATFIFDKKGKLKRTLNGKKTYENFISAITEVIKLER